MTDFIALPLDKIHIAPDRSREVDEAYAATIAASMQQHFQFQPIIVRRTPNGKAPYTLVDGAHRCRAVKLTDGAIPQINAMVVKANSSKAAMVEVAANIFRNELTILDRAIAVGTYRAEWEKTHGKIERGHNNLPNSTINADLAQNVSPKSFGEDCAERLGLSKRSIERSNQLTKNLSPQLVFALRKSSAADNQAQLLRFSKLPPAAKAKAVRALELAEYDPAKALDALSDKKPDRRNAQEKLKDTCTIAFCRLRPAVQDKLLEHLLDLQKARRSKEALKTGHVLKSEMPVLH